MKGRRLGLFGFLLIACLIVTGFAAARAKPNGSSASGTLAATGCQLNSAGDKIKHVVYLQFDNTHYTRDNQSVASDLEQMPHLLNFLQSNGTFFTNDHTVLISHTAGGILSSLTGLYPDRHGMGISNSYFYYTPSKIPAFSTSFKYWTDLVDDATGTNDSLPNMVTDGKTTPAPWVPFTRAGCDFGAISLANIELENTGTGAFGDMTQAFGAHSPEWDAAVASNAAPAGTAARAKALTDYVGIAIHCANGGGICAANPTNIANSRPDNLPQEPNGYTGYSALFGAKYVNPAINAGSASVNNMDGSPVTDPFGQPGFPGFDGALATNTLGYIAQMQEAGIPITYGYISDAHDNHTSSFPAPFNPLFPRASGPGEADYRAQLAAYDDAFDKFFKRLQDDGIDKSNTLFVVTVDEGDQFAGGIGTPQGDGSLAYNHANCSWTTTPSCPSNQIGEVNYNIKAKLPAETPLFSVHRDSAPAFWVNGQPDRTDAKLRKMERDVAGLTSIDPYVSPDPQPIFVQMADTVEEKTLHMVSSDPARTPSFTAFADPNYFVTDTGPSCGSNPCIDYHFAWSHGDIQPQIGTTWAGMVGPGVDHTGNYDGWTDHTDIRPTMLSLLGLSDDYGRDGRVVSQVLEPGAVPATLQTSDALALGDMLKRIDAPFGEFAMNTLKASTVALTSDTNHDNRYTTLEKSIAQVTDQRDQVVDGIKALLGAAESGTPIDHTQAAALLDRAQGLLGRAAGLAGH
jgi:hypothetical protein